MPVVLVWDDITYHHDTPGAQRRWTIGWLIHDTDELLLASTWDEDGYSDFHTFPRTPILEVQKWPIRSGDDSSPS